jgi:hypothetical protein
MELPPKNKKEKYHMILLYHSWTCNRRNQGQHTIEILALLFIHYSQKPNFKTSLDAYQPMKG